MASTPLNSQIEGAVPLNILTSLSKTYISIELIILSIKKK